MSPAAAVIVVALCLLGLWLEQRHHRRRDNPLDGLQELIDRRLEEENRR